MSKASTLAAALIGAGLGTDGQYMSRFDDTSAVEDIKLFSEVAFYAPHAVDMVEAAYGVAFVYPEDYLYVIYRNFGETLSDNTAQNGETHELPDRSEMLNELEELVINTFETVTGEAQRTAMENAVHRVRQAIP